MKKREIKGGKESKFKFKINDIVNLLVFRNYRDLTDKYKIRKDTLVRVEKALQKGRWEIVA